MVVIILKIAQTISIKKMTLLIHLILSTTVLVGAITRPIFIDEEIEVQRCLKSGPCS